jgi:hypothetical protein
MLERAIYYAVFVDEQADLAHLVDDLVRLEMGDRSSMAGKMTSPADVNNANPAHP